MTKKRAEDILLESGTNELEIVEFSLGEEFYGINVAKVREIIRASVGIVPVPDAHPSISGVINLRGKIIPVVHLAKHLKIETQYDPKRSRIIIAEFNQLQAGFWVNHVTRIHRLSWKQVEAPSSLIQSKKGYAVGVVKLTDRVLFLLDFEKISSDINPETGIRDSRDAHFEAADVPFDRSQKQILIAEDSAFIRDMLSQYVQEAGYRVTAVSNGEEAWTCLNESLRRGQTYHLVITDIEMPQMDGLHLIKRIKDDARLANVPCVVFSSMITEDLSVKCRKVGAVAQISKPEIDGLVRLVDQHVL